MYLTQMIGCQNTFVDLLHKTKQIVEDRFRSSTPY